VATDPQLQLLVDRAAISDTVYGYATGLDRRDWKLYRSIFTDSIVMDFESVGIPPGTFDADTWVRDAQRLFAGFSATQHTSSNHAHDVRGDEASCTSNMRPNTSSRACPTTASKKAAIAGRSAATTETSSCEPKRAGSCAL
jgi:hypothetical protein